MNFHHSFPFYLVHFGNTSVLSEADVRQEAWGCEPWLASSHAVVQNYL